MFKGFVFFVKQGWKYDKLYIIWNVLYQLMNSLIPIIGILIPKFIIDELMGAKRPEKLFIYVAGLVGCTLISSALSVYFSKDGFTRRGKVAAEFDHDMHRRLCMCDYENLESPDFLDMREKANKFLTCDYHGFGYLLDCALNIIGQLLTLSAIITIIATYKIWIVILFVLLSLVGAMVETREKKKAWVLSDAVVRDERGWRYYCDLFESQEYAKEIRLNSMANLLLRNERYFFERVLNNYRKQNNFFIKAGVVGSLLTCVRQCTAYGYLIYEVIAGTVSIGSFTMYISAITAFASALSSVMDSISEIRTYDLYYDKLDQYLSVPTTLRQGKCRLEGKQHTIEYRHVSYRYPGSNIYALEDVNVVIHPGEKLLIVGENGAGKTTFIKLLTRLYDPTDGEILLDGTNIREIDYDWYMDLFSAVFQDFKLFPFSLKENVAIEQPKNPQHVENILRNIGFGRRLDQLPKGLDTEITKVFDEMGFEPSGGEGQKISLARALYKNTDFVILDEPTAALDPRAEFELYQNFSELVDGKTAVFISHRMGSAKFCDMIAVFSKGKIVEYGSHDALIKQSGMYSEYYKMQAEQYISY